MANTAATVLKELVGGSNAGGLISSISISGETKHAFAREDPSIDTKELISNRQYKKKHRRKCILQQEMCSGPRIQCKDRQSDHVDCVEKCNDSILLLTGMRDGLQDAQSLAGRPVVLVKVSASDEA